MVKLVPHKRLTFLVFALLVALFLAASVVPIPAGSQGPYQQAADKATAVRNNGFGMEVFLIFENNGRVAGIGAVPSSGSSSCPSRCTSPEGSSS